MVQATGEERAVHLAREAVELFDAGHREAASRNLREALSITRDNPDVKAAFLKIQQEEESGHPLLDLCRRYTTRKDETAGKEAAAYLRTDGLKPPENVALESLKLLLDQRAHALSELQDEIISGLVRQNASVRQYFSNQLQISVTTFFDEIYDRGDGAAVCLDTVVLDPKVWPSEDTRLHCESELFQLFLAKLMESGHDLDGRALKGITRLLAVDAGRLKHLVDDDVFEVILTSLDNRLPLELRSQATLATAKYLEVSKESGEKQFSALISAMIGKGRLNDLIIAFSAVAAVFPVVPTAAANVFLSEDFMNALAPLATRDATRKKVEVSILELLNAACINRPCREAVAKRFSEWLSHTLTNGSDEGSELAAVVLAKIRASETIQSSTKNGEAQEENTGVTDLVQRFKGLMSEPKVENISHAIEGLAYSSVQPSVKEQLAKDPTFMRDLISVLKQHTTDSSVLYGGLMIILNLTKFLPNLSDEQKKMSQLKNYADASTGKARASTDPRDADDVVLERCGIVIDNRVMALLVDCGRVALPSTNDLTAKILLALARRPKSRGTLAQQGAIKLLLGLSIPQQGQPVGHTETTHNASHALARILISVDPSHVFPSTGFPQATSPVRPLLSLLAAPEGATISVDQPRDLLPVFESLLALTNLASYPRDDAPAELIVREGWSVIEELLLSSNSRVQRAACELVCNLMTCESGIIKFADATKRASQRLHIMLALTDVDDMATRRAAGGAIAMLTEYDAAVAAVLERPRGVELLLGLCQEEDGALVHRGVVCVHNLTTASGDIGARAKTAVQAAGGIDILTTCLKKTSNPAVLQTGVEALKPLVQPQA
ncbi:actin cytoskeleton organization protein [Penicillium brasilianum]|uniref:Actin cytoskeleton organization protein n=1 Tax=Penicillium brasilianum TaxID=104259 RepID=A0A1S9RUU6_PENBI|nr:actin cytoskeleton organization protein [Penicillium brasilianum]